MVFYHKSVRYNLSKIEVNAYRPTNPGINCTFGDYDFVNNEVTVHYSCSDNPLIAPNERRTMDDIEDEISRLEPRIVKETHCSLKVDFHGAIKFIMDNHALDGQYDFMRSKAVMKHSVMLPKIEIKDINKFYEKQNIKALDDDQQVFEVGEIIE